MTPLPTDLTITAFDESRPGLEAVVDAGLDRFNDAHAAFDGQRPLNCAARDARQAVVGGAVGRTLGQCAELTRLWVDDAQRGRGVGAALVRAFERRARDRGCVTVYLSTFSFQARPFYEQLGYRVALEIPGHGAAGSKFLMLRTLADTDGRHGPTQT